MLLTDNNQGQVLFKLRNCQEIWFVIASGRQHVAVTAYSFWFVAYKPTGSCRIYDWTSSINLQVCQDLLHSLSSFSFPFPWRQNNLLKNCILFYKHSDPIKKTYTGTSQMYKPEFYRSISEQFVEVTSLGQIDSMHLMKGTFLNSKACTCPVTGHTIPITWPS